MATLCSLFGKTRQAYYSIEKRIDQRVVEQAIVLELVAQIRSDMPKIGTPKLHHMLSPSLKQHDIKMGRDALHELLSNHGLLIRKKRRRVMTTNSRHRFRKYDNLTKNIELTCSEQLWVTDITYISLERGFCYLSLITDAYSGMVVGFCLYETLASTGPILALRMALSIRKYYERPLIHHSDRGVQYCCDEYVQILNDNEIRISMAAKGNPYENPKAERMNGILKDELRLDTCFSNYDQAREETRRAIHIYNHQRPHSSCDYLTPAQAHLKRGKLKSRWKKKGKNEKQKV